MDCLFCRIVRGEEEAVKVYEDDFLIVIMDRYPRGLGHVLVIPKAHYETLFDMDYGDVGRLFEYSVAVAKALVGALKADGVNIGVNNGRAANQIIPHVHVHVIPRFYGDSIGFPPKRRASLEELEEVAKLVRDEVSSAIKNITHERV